MKLLIIICMIFLSVFCSDATAGELNQKLNNFPEWQKLTSVKPAVGDLIYPEWMKGEWEVKSTLIDLFAPLAPDIVTPGFESNRQYLNQPISFKVRFVNQSKVKNLTPSYRTPLSFTRRGEGGEVIADRAYNGLNLARAVLGEEAVKAVKVDPDSPNRQITFLRSECTQRINCDRQLVSIVKNRAIENTDDGKFITAEVFEQLFKGSSVPYINTVESTTAYKQLSQASALNPIIEANQVTAVYLSSQDPNYFKAVNQPVALYKYRLEFFPIDKKIMAN
ncbi:MAG: hypothetical protein KI793_26495 [Rivularia sp. (in: Bacteria)]|nr:hypothetical protein [Rivularia sp. MS3]